MYRQDKNLMPLLCGTRTAISASLRSTLEDPLLRYSLRSLMLVFSAYYISTSAERDFSYVIHIRSSSLRFIFQSERRTHNAQKKAVWLGIIKRHKTQARDTFSWYSTGQITQLRTCPLLRTESDKVKRPANDNVWINNAPLCPLDFITRGHYLSTLQVKP
jgi:hypothetical protein